MYCTGMPGSARSDEAAEAAKLCRPYPSRIGTVGKAHDRAVLIIAAIAKSGEFAERAAEGGKGVRHRSFLPMTTGRSSC